MRLITLMSLICIIIVLVGCHANELSEPELREYLANPDNGLIKECQIEDLTISVCYQPAALLGISLPEHAREQPIDQNVSCSQYFLVTLSRNTQEVLDPAQGFSAFSSLLQTLAFRPQEYLKLTTSKGDTLMPSNSELERTFGMSTSTQLLVAFPAGDMNQDITVHLGEFGLRTGTLRFDFNRQDLLALPQLKYSGIKEEITTIH